MEKITILFILVFGHIFTLHSTNGKQTTGNITMSSCVGDFMDLMCPSGSNITILKALYGYAFSKANNCSEGRGNCSWNIPFDVNITCGGIKSCSFKAEARYVPQSSNCPYNRTNNLIVTYACSAVMAAATTMTTTVSSLSSALTTFISRHPSLSTTRIFALSTPKATLSMTTTIPVTTRKITKITLSESSPYPSAWGTIKTSDSLRTDKSNEYYTAVSSSIKNLTPTTEEHISTHTSTESKMNPASKIERDENPGTIIGGAVGGSLFLVLLIFITVILICRQRMSHFQNLSTTKSSNIELLSGRDPSKVGTGEGELNQYVIETENSLYYAEASEHSCHQNTAVDLIAGSSTQFSEDDNGTTTHHYTEIDNPKSHNQYDEIDSAMLQENTDKKDQLCHNQYEDINMEDQDDHNPCESENKLNPILLKQNYKTDQRCYNQYEDINMEDQENDNSPFASNTKKASHVPIYFELEPEGNHYSVIDIENETQVETPDRDLTTHYQMSDDNEDEKANSPVDLNMLYAKSTKHRRSNDAFFKNAETAGSAEDVVMIENVIYNMEEE